VTFDLYLDLEHTLDAGYTGDIVCKFGGDPAIRDYNDLDSVSDVLLLADVFEN